MSQKPTIEYPCEWSWRCLGEDEDGIRAAIEAAVGDTPCTVEPSHTSSSGRYTSLRVTLEVQDEAQRQAITDALGNDPRIRIVL